MADKIRDSDGRDDDKGSASKRPRSVEVGIVGRQGKVVLVAWLDDGKYKRVTIPANKLKGNDAPADVLASGIPWGEDWESLFGEFTGFADIANELRRANIWTVEDFRAGLTTVRAILTRLFVNPLVDELLKTL